MSASESAVPVVVEFCGEEYPVATGGELSIGRAGDLVVDDNPHLHRRFLRVVSEPPHWWLVNEGRVLAATVHDEIGLVRMDLAPGARAPLVSSRTTVLFTAGSTTYELSVRGPGLSAASWGSATVSALEGEATIGAVVLNENQKLLLVALCEPVLRRSGAVGAVLPTSAAAAARLGWTTVAFNRRLDNVCEKLARHGVTGLHGGRGNLASGRKARLVEHCIASRLIVEGDLALLPSTR